MHFPTLAVTLSAASAFIPAVTADFTFNNWQVGSSLRFMIENFDVSPEKSIWLTACY
jgi:hypothetical protein